MKIVSSFFLFIFSKLETLSKLRIPTVLGLFFVLLGLGVGVYLVLQNQSLLTQASSDQLPQNIVISNIEGNKVTLSWQTKSITSGFVTFGINNPSEQTALDDKDQSAPKSYYTHHVNLLNLSPQTEYQFKIVSGKTSSDVQRFTTAMESSPTNSEPIIGTVLNRDETLDDAVAYLSIAGSIVQSASVKNGNFLIPLSQIRQQDLSTILVPKIDTLGKITIISASGNSNILVRLNDIKGPLGPIKLGDTLDLTVNQPSNQITPTPTPTTTANPDLLKYDLSGDGIINSSDYAVVLRNFGKSPQNKRADINSDGIVDQKDLSEMSKKINEQRR